MTTTMDRPARPVHSTAYQINRLRTVLHWLEDNAHTLPDGCDLQCDTSEFPALIWWGRGSHPSADTVDAAAVIERLSEAHGQRDDEYCNGHHWRINDRRAVSMSVYEAGVTA